MAGEKGGQSLQAMVGSSGVMVSGELKVGGGGESFGGQILGDSINHP
jgi:hypothetical protein